MKRWVIGVDEVGRGPIAGPIAVGAVLLPAEHNEWKHWEGLKDSKKLSEKKRLFWREALGERSVRYAVSSVAASIIEEKGIVYAAQSAAREAVELLEVAAEEAAVLLDKNLRLPDAWEQEEFVKGDERFPVIALASIVAKLERDAYMVDLDTRLPNYGFAAHKGYGTKAHYAALRALGLTHEHRASWINL